MNKSLSLYLDLIRFIAAVAVFFAHVPMFIGGYMWQVAGLGHQAVVVFFLLSGFVIAFVTKEKEIHISEYLINRASRIYSVAIPALIISWLVYKLGLEFRPEVFVSFNGEFFSTIPTFLSALTFTNQSWIGVNIFANPPYWSLSYEVLYYLFFAVVYYLKGIKKVILAFILIFIMGPSILLYLPIWFLGVLCYKHIKLFSHLSVRLSTALFATSLLAMILLNQPNIESYINSFASTLLGNNIFSLLLHPSQSFLVDYLIAACVASNILLYSNIYLQLIGVVNRLEKSIRYLASYTFSTYLYHFPVLCFYSIFFPYDTNPLESILLTLIATPLTVWVIGYFTESQKHLYKRGLKHLFKLKTKRI